ncbi:MAG: hypothetical protein A4E23_00891 [Methanomethylovorans sp. PtaU1.Bin073]|nr:MAG: hypothetical protein A4E23_00891 [Methanomethylovorans sp. PtaU1.Bin073]
MKPIAFRRSARDLLALIPATLVSVPSETIARGIGGAIIHTSSTICWFFCQLRFLLSVRWSLKGPNACAAQSIRYT